MYIEDVDLCYRAHQAGYDVVYFPQVAVTHHIGKSTETMPNRSIVQWHRSMWRYYRKHMRGNLPLDVLTLAGIGARCAYQLALQNGRRLLAGEALCGFVAPALADDVADAAVTRPRIDCMTAACHMERAYPGRRSPGGWPRK
jgi:GT2 family glycosyltransferase